MGNTKEEKTLTRRDALTLAGTAAAFCASFGFLRAAETGGEDSAAAQFSGDRINVKWERAEIKWYKGGQVIATSEFPPIVLKYLQNDERSVVEIKWWRNGLLQNSLCEFQGKL
jgi:hypothetical protein